MVTDRADINEDYVFDAGEVGWPAKSVINASDDGEATDR